MQIPLRCAICTILLPGTVGFDLIPLAICLYRIFCLGAGRLTSQSAQYCLRFQIAFEFEPAVGLCPLHTYMHTGRERADVLAVMHSGAFKRSVRVLL